MLLTILAVTPVLAVLLVMAAQPLFELWDARASEWDVPSTRAAELPAIPDPVEPQAFPEALGGMAAVLRIPEPRRAHAPAGR